jgi:hypothetical protein
MYVSLKNFQNLHNDCARDQQRKFATREVVHTKSSTCMYVNMQVYMHIYTYIYMHVHTYMRTCAPQSVHVCVCVRASVCIRIHTCMDTYMRTCAPQSVQLQGARHAGTGPAAKQHQQIASNQNQGADDCLNSGGTRQPPSPREQGCCQEALFMIHQAINDHAAALEDLKQKLANTAVALGGLDGRKLSKYDRTGKGILQMKDSLEIEQQVRQNIQSE